MARVAANTVTMVFCGAMVVALSAVAEAFGPESNAKRSLTLLSADSPGKCMDGALDLLIVRSITVVVHNCVSGKYFILEECYWFGAMPGLHTHGEGVWFG